eukprot:scaffold33583_cov79-Attheya_sp.AAC.1
MKRCSGQEGWWVDMGFSRKLWYITSVVDSIVLPEDSIWRRHMNPLNYHHSHCLREENVLYNEVPSVLGNDVVHSSGCDVVDPPDFWLPVLIKKVTANDYEEKEDMKPAPNKVDKSNLVTKKPSKGNGAKHKYIPTVWMEEKRMIKRGKAVFYSSLMTRSFKLFKTKRR